MRGLNLLRDKSDNDLKSAWKNHQYSEIASNIDAHQGLRPLFPGSLLFNQILVPTEATTSPECLSDVMPDTRDVEFKFCSQQHRDSSLQNTVLIDIDDAVEIPPVEVIDELINSSSSIEQVAFLGKSAGISLKDLSVNNADVGFYTVEPEWRSAYALHALYRNAQHVVFIDSMRVLDAAFTGCGCTLVATDDFQKDVAFDFLLNQLDKTECTAYDPNGRILLSKQEECSFNITENNIHDVKAQLAAGSRLLPEADDWLTSLVCEKVSPVIDCSDNNSGGSWSNILDRKTRFLRKASKLRDDPVAFLSDSDSRILKAAARVFPASRNTG